MSLRFFIDIIEYLLDVSRIIPEYNCFSRNLLNFTSVSLKPDARQYKVLMSLDDDKVQPTGELFNDINKPAIVVSTPEETLFMIVRVDNISSCTVKAVRIFSSGIDCQIMMDMLYDTNSKSLFLQNREYFFVAIGGSNRL